MGWFGDRAARARTGWWRRNWWGLAAALPLFAVAVVFSPNDSYHTWRTSEPREALAPGGDGWVGYGEVDLRLVALEPADLRGDDPAEPFPLPEGLRAWQATLAVTVPADPDALVACDVELEDQAGRRFAAAPEELIGARRPDGLSLEITSCGVLDEEDAADGEIETVAYFVMPRPAQPAAVRVTSRDQLPAYVRLDVS